MTEKSQTTDEAQIRALIDERVKAVRAKDVDAAMANVATDSLSFDVVGPLQQSGSAASRKRAQEWFASFEGAIGLEVRELSITTSDSVAFCHGLNHVSAKRADGGKLDMWWRATICFQKFAGRWMVTHEHNSVPFDPESGKASLDLKL